MQSESTERQLAQVRPSADPDPLAVVAPGNIVVGIDGSPGSTEALIWALGEARRRHLTVEGVLAWNDALATGPPTPIAALTKAQQLRLQGRVTTVVEAASDAVDDHNAPIRTHIFSGEPAEMLSTLAPQAAMVVVGSRGYGTLRGAVLGSVSRHCAQMATGVTVVVRGPRSTRPPDEPRRVMVGLDGSPTSMAALQWAAAVGTQAGDHLTLTYAWGSNGIGMESGDMADRLTRSGREMLQGAALDLVDSGRLVTTQLDYGPAEVMLAGCSEGADLLVVGSRGRSGLSGLLLGSVSLYCVSHARCPVAVVRPPLTSGATST